MEERRKVKDLRAVTDSEVKKSVRVHESKERVCEGRVEGAARTRSACRGD